MCYECTGCMCREFECTVPGFVLCDVLNIQVCHAHVIICLCVSGGSVVLVFVRTDSQSHGFQGIGPWTPW